MLAGASSIKVFANDEVDGSKIKFKRRKISTGTHKLIMIICTRNNTRLAKLKHVAQNRQIVQAGCVSWRSADCAEPINGKIDFRGRGKAAGTSTVTVLLLFGTISCSNRGTR